MTDDRVERIMRARDLANKLIDTMADVCEFEISRVHFDVYMRVPRLFMCLADAMVIRGEDDLQALRAALLNMAKAIELMPDAMRKQWAKGRE